MGGTLYLPSGGVVCLCQVIFKGMSQFPLVVPRSSPPCPQAVRPPSFQCSVVICIVFQEVCCHLLSLCVKVSPQQPTAFTVSPYPRFQGAWLWIMLCFGVVSPCSAAWSSLNFLVLWFYSFHQIWKTSWLLSHVLSTPPAPRILCAPHGPVPLPRAALTSLPLCS